jgi:hypothetical protein
VVSFAGEALKQEGMIMFGRRLIPVWIGIIALSGIFLTGQETWPPPTVSVDTQDWDHLDTEGTAVRIWGALGLSESIENWNEGFVWDTEAHDNWQDYPNKVWADNYAPINRFSVNIEGLDRFTEYHYRAYVESLPDGETKAVGEDHTFIPGGPRVYTHLASDLDQTSADLNGELGHMGGATSVDVLFEYGEDQASPDIVVGEQTLTELGSFSTTLTDLESCTKYFFQAVGSNDADTHTGWTLQFSPGEPNASTGLPTDVGTDTATLKGRLWDLAGMPSADVWFRYGDISPDNLDQSTTPQTLDATGEFSEVIGGLNPGTRYWVRAFVDNGLCTNQGAIVAFTTEP